MNYESAIRDLRQRVRSLEKWRESTGILPDPPTDEPVPPPPPVDEPDPPPPTGEWWDPSPIVATCGALAPYTVNREDRRDDATNCIWQDLNPVQPDAYGYGWRALGGQNITIRNCSGSFPAYALHTEDAGHLLVSNCDFTQSSGSETCVRLYQRTPAAIAFAGSTLHQPHDLRPGVRKPVLRAHGVSTLVSHGCTWTGSNIWIGGPDRGQPWSPDLWPVEDFWFVSSNHTSGLLELRNCRRATFAYCDLLLPPVNRHGCEVRIGPGVYFSGARQPETGP